MSPFTTSIPLPPIFLKIIKPQHPYRLMKKIMTIGVLEKETLSQCAELCYYIN